MQRGKTAVGENVENDKWSTFRSRVTNGKKASKKAKIYQNAHAWTGEFAGFLLEGRKTLGTRLNDRKCQSPVLSWNPPANEGLFNAKFDILVPRASILLVSVRNRSLTLTKRTEALWTRMEIWGSQFMKLLHKFPYGGPYGPAMWRAFERKGKKTGRKKKREKKSLECAFTHLGFFTRSAVMKSLACCEMGSKCFGLNS